MELRRNPAMCHADILLTRHMDRSTRVIITDVPEEAHTVHIGRGGFVDFKGVQEKVDHVFDYCATPGKTVSMTWAVAVQTSNFLKETI